MLREIVNIPMRYFCCTCLYSDSDCVLSFFTPFFAARSHSSFDIRCSQNHIAHLPPLNIYNYRTIPRHDGHDDDDRQDDDTVSAAQQFAVREYIEVGNIDVMMIAYNICVLSFTCLLHRKAACWFAIRSSYFLYHFWLNFACMLKFQILFPMCMLWRSKNILLLKLPV